MPKDQNSGDKPKPKPRLLSPRTGAHRPTSDPEPATELDAGGREAVALAEEIEDAVENRVSDGAKTRAFEFFEEVLEKAGKIADSVRRMGRATEGQLVALRNMRDGVMKWVRD